jgi:hypothetical protein
MTYRELRKAYRVALAGLKCCDNEAMWVARNGHAVCTECYGRHERAADFTPLNEDGVKCDRRVDGMGAASWHKRLDAAIAAL